MSNLYQERDEAIEAGERALRCLRNAKSELDSARGWGIFDIFSDGLLSNLIKHGKLNKASQSLEEAKWELERFSQELDDVSDITGYHFDIGGFATFADFFFDGLVADLYVQSKINQARGNVKNAINRVESVLRELRSM